MKTIIYLLYNRERPKTFARAVKVWGKRILHLPSLTCLLWRSSRLAARGARVGSMSVIGEVEVMGRIQNLSIGSQSTLGRCHLAVFADLTIGSRVVINDGVRILTASHDVRSLTWARVEKPVIIEDYVWIATGATILPGVCIGRGAVVAAGAVVAKSVPAGHVVIGNPSRDIGVRRAAALDYNPTALVSPYEAWIGREQNGEN